MRATHLLPLALLIGCSLDDSPLTALGAGDAAASLDAGIAPRDAGGRDAGPDAGAILDAAVEPVDAALLPVELPTFGPARLLEGVNTKDDDLDPVPSHDGLTLVFARRQDFDSGPRDLWMATRAAAGDPWRDERPLGELNTSQDDSNPCWFEGAGGLWLYYVSTFDQDGSDDRDIRVASFREVSADFEYWGHVTTLNSVLDESDPTLSADGEILMFARPVEGLASELIEARGEALDDFTDPRVGVAELSSDQEEYDPALSADGRVLVFASYRPPAGEGDLWITLRQSPDGRFEEPVQLPTGGDEAINTDAEERDPYLTPQGDLYFASDRSGAFDLYVAEGSW